MAEHQITEKGLSYRHEYIVDWCLKHPEGLMKDLAAELGVSEQHLSLVRNSDAFKDYEARRRAEHNETLSKSIVEEVEDLAHLSVEVLNERIESERQTLGLTLVRETADMALKALGFGSRRGDDNRSINTLVINGADPALLERARARMRAANSVPEEPEDVEAPTVPTPG
ncbi:MAG: hypothetical protein ACE5HV_00125 [Acidobacteriota bacterium]